MRTIRDAPRVFAPIVRSLKIICHVPEDFMKVTAGSIGYLLKTCPSLTRVSLEEGMAAYRMFEVIWGLPDTPGLLVNAEQFALSCLSQDID